MSQTVDVGFYLPSTNLLDLLVSFSWCFPIVQFRSDCAWITCTMKKPKYNNLAIFYHKINSVWKSSKQKATKFAINLWIKQGILRNLTNAGIKHAKVFLSKTWRLRFVPCIPTDNIVFYFWKKPDVVHHFLFSILA